MEYCDSIPDLFSLAVLVQAVYVGVNPKLGVAPKSVTVRTKIYIMRPVYWISIPGHGLCTLTFHAAHHGAF